MKDTLINIGEAFPFCLTIVDTSPDRDRPCLYANSKFFANTGYTPDFAIGRNLSFLQGKLTSKDSIEFMKNCFFHRKACIQDIINYKADGTPFLNRLLLLPIRSSRESLYLGFQNDITEEKGLHYSNKSLEKISDGEIKHFINNPLTIILNGLSDRFEEINCPEKKKEFQSKLEDAFARILNYSLDIEQLSEFEKFDYYKKK